MNDDKVIICRCEDLTLKELRELLKRGYTTFDEIKRLSRAGMGPCQGKTCKQLILNEIKKYTRLEIDKIPIRPTAVRPPSRPLIFNEILESENERNR
ncbi:MAG: Hydrogen cyanide synthase subunit HcnB [candidate division WS2 bacterium]|nr:Hydrogen cyanide synthase subunit HcnB [Candidatus Lithacetigena glycinireducens]